MAISDALKTYLGVQNEFYGKDASNWIGPIPDNFTGGDQNDYVEGKAFAPGEGLLSLAFSNGKVEALDGGGGINTLGYSESPAGVDVSLGVNLTEVQDALGTFPQFASNVWNFFLGWIAPWDNTDTYTVIQTVGGDADHDAASHFQNVVGSAFNDILGGDANANILVGLGGDDVLAGGDGNDTLMGGAGKDALVGGNGSDTAAYDLAPQLQILGVNTGIGLTASLATPAQNTGEAAGDAYDSIENISGSAFADTLIGNDGANALSGNAGDDILQGGAGLDTLSGGDGTDTLQGGAGGDILNGGTDTADYASATAGVTADLGNLLQNTGDAAGDLYVGIENLTGSNSNDRLVGDLNANVLNGGGGDDTLIGGGGGDTLVGGGGTDTVDYSGSSAKLTFDPATMTVSDGQGHVDHLSGIEKVILPDGSIYAIGANGAVTLTGGAGNDALTGDAGMNSLGGGAGNDILTGLGGADTLDGGAGTDTADYAGSPAGVNVNLTTGLGSGGDAQGDTLANIENLNGSAYADTLTGNAGPNALNGLGGNDTLVGAGGADQLNGGAGTDTASYLGSAAGVSVSLATGLGSGGDAQGDTLTGIESLTGSANDDTLAGNAGANTLDGQAGNDTLIGGGGADTLTGGAGTDTADYRGSSAGVTVNLLTGTGTGGDAQGDTLGGVENLTGTPFVDTLIGDGNANLLDGLASNDTLQGNDGDDVLRGGSGADRLDGGAGTDTASYFTGKVGVSVDLTTGKGTGGDAQGDTLVSIENISGSQGGDTLVGNGGANTLQGWGGDDVLRGGAGADKLDGGAGTDTASYYTSSAAIHVDLSTGKGSYGDAQGDSLVSIENISGSQGSDTLLGSSVANLLDGQRGDDSLSGQSGDDVLRGGAGADHLDGGAGTDTASYYTSTIGVSVDLSTGKGSGGDAQGDTLVAIETLSGSQGDDTLVGDGGTNTLQGWNGGDVLRGGAGADHLDGGAGTDTASYDDSSVGVTVNLATGLGSRGDAQGDTLAGIENVDGSQGGDTITGGAGANLLQGLGGNDSLYGGDGNDALRGGAGADHLDGGAGSDTASYATGSVGISVNLATGAISGGDAQGDTLVSIENLTGSQGKDTLVGDSNANTLLGWDGNDALRGGAGDDVLNGGYGKDTLTGDAGADHFVFSSFDHMAAGVNADLITDFSRTEGDRIDLSGVDADTGLSGNQSFTFIGTDAYSGHAGELRFAQVDGHTNIGGDVNGDGVSDFNITLSGLVTLQASDFVL